MSSVYRWTDLTVIEGATMEELPDNDPRALKALDQFRRTGSISHYFLAQVGESREDPEDASTWGPASSADVDWTGFDEALAAAKEES